MFGLSIALVFAVGPTFYKKAKSDKTNFSNTSRVRYFSLDYAFDSEKYMQLKLIINKGDTVNKNYFIPEKEHKEVISFLVKEKFVTTNNIREILPFKLTSKQLQSLRNIIFKLNGKHIEVLAIDDYYLVGNKPTIVGKVIYYGLGIIFIAIGLLAFFLSSLVFIDIFKIYQKTGEFPNLPNSINSKLEGLKYIFRGFKLKNKND
ncbi:hypothetical protein [Maribacter polysaccharolyticus]|uniref:hypothetical protein n=1 Tax=Maribacter polysaccharolyticus TaxID=3020831 RepID=UPI00237F0A0C|nr:hypothetical protein [Maribacter polysaccharolyticus]MDE3740309.1 hypothetical protein [Maribacter polysaccharolyticus]